jgi:protein-L-isoaspartate(D-aspartate) O-methyltransferase
MTAAQDRRAQDPAVLRAAMVSDLRDMEAIASDAVAAAFGAVPRQVFAADEPLEAVYDANMPLVTKRGADGAALSSLSAAHIQAVMLEQAAIEPGTRVLEVGSGGYNAALIAELVGGDGSVTTVDIDADIVARARRCLQAAGYDQVQVLQADAEHGVPGHASYDRIIVTVGAWDIPPAWLDQLNERGRIVVPLRFAALTRCIARGTPCTPTQGGCDVDPDRRRTHGAATRPTWWCVPPPRPALPWPSPRTRSASSTSRRSSPPTSASAPTP